MPTLADDVYSKIKNLIFSGEYKPNTRINIDNLANQLCCSKTPVREALKKLNAEGFVAYEQRKGYKMQYLSLADYLKKYEIQEMMETYLVKKIAMIPYCVDFEQLQRINNNIMRFRSEKQFDLIPQENELFHGMLYQNYHNDLIVKEIKKIWNEVKLQRNLMSLHSPFVATVAEEHNKILEAIKECDPVKAEQCMAEHYKSGREAILLQQKW